MLLMSTIMKTRGITRGAAAGSNVCKCLDNQADLRAHVAFALSTASHGVSLFVCVDCLRVYVWCCVGEQALVVLAALRYAHVSDETCFFGKKAKQICTAELIVLRGGIGIADGFQGVDFWPVERIATDAQTVVEAWVAVCKRERARVCNICI